MKPIPSFENYYATKDGRIWSSKTNKFLKQCARNEQGHLVVSLPEKKQYVHRLILETFVSPCPKNMECRHLDGNPANNKLSNLKWGTSRENSLDAVKHKTYYHAQGEGHGRAKLTNNKVREIRKLLKLGFTRRQLGELYGVAHSVINCINARKTWKHI